MARERKQEFVTQEGFDKEIEELLHAGRTAWEIKEETHASSAYIKRVHIAIDPAYSQKVHEEEKEAQAKEQAGANTESSQSLGNYWREPIDVRSSLPRVLGTTGGKRLKDAHLLNLFCHRMPIFCPSDVTCLQCIKCIKTDESLIGVKAPTGVIEGS